MYVTPIEQLTHISVRSTKKNGQTGRALKVQIADSPVVEDGDIPQPVPNGCPNDTPNIILDNSGLDGVPSKSPKKKKPLASLAVSMLFLFHALCLKCHNRT